MERFHYFVVFYKIEARESQAFEGAPFKPMWLHERIAQTLYFSLICQPPRFFSFSFLPHRPSP